MLLFLIFSLSWSSLLILFTSIYIFGWWLDNNYLTGVPTYISYDLRHWIFHFFILIKTWSSTRQYQNSKNENTIYGYAARNLLQTFLNTQPDDIKILTTPIHHTSFIKILNNCNVKIMNFTDDYRNLIYTEEDIMKADVIIVTHLFGRNFNIKNLYSMCKQHNKLLFIDAITGFKQPPEQLLQSTNADITLYSSGQDKRPVALGGGIAIVRNANLCHNMKCEIRKFPKETNWKRFKNLINLFFIRILYTSSFIQFLIHLYIKIRKQKLSEIVDIIRTSNSGFSNNDYLYAPHVSLVASLDFEINYGQEEMLKNVDHYRQCWSIYLSF